MVQQLLHRFSKLLSRAKRSHFNFRLRPSCRFSHFLDRRVFTIDHQQRLLVLRRKNSEQSIREIRCYQTVLDGSLFHTVACGLLVHPALLVVGEIRNSQLWSSFRTPHHVQTRVCRDPCQPAFEGAATFKAPKLRKCFQKNFLRRFFHHASLPEEPARHAEYSRAVSSHYLCKGRLVTVVRLSRQIEVQGLFEPTLQLRSSSV